MGIGKPWGRLVALAAISALFTAGAVAQVTSRFVAPGSAVASTKAVPGGTFAMDFRVDAPATQTIGASFLVIQTVPAAPSSFFQITARDFTASIFNDTASGTPDATVLALPSALLNPANDDNLGRNTIGLAGAASGMNLFVETITFSVDPATPLGTYTIKPASGGNSAVTDVALNDYDMSLTASFDILVGRTLSVTKSGSAAGTVTSNIGVINCGAVCSDIYAGSTVTLTAAPAGSSTFVGWSGGGCSGTGTCVVTVNAATTVNAQFDLVPQSLTVTLAGTGTGTVTSLPAGINCAPTCNASFAAGTVVTLTAAPAVGSALAGWSGGGCSGTGTCVVTMNSVQAVTATFVLQPDFNLTVIKSGAGSGTVTSAPSGVNCGATCALLYPGGTVVTLTATPAAGSTFGGWTGGGCAGTGTCVVTMIADTVVTAQFVVTPASLLSAVSRRTHGAAGTFDLALSVVAAPAVNHNPTTDPRQGPAHTIVFTFDKPITAATAGVTEGTATTGAPLFSGNIVSVVLTGVLDRQYVTVSLTNVTATDGSFGGNASVRIGFLMGDVNQNRVVTVADLGLVNSLLTQTVTGTNYLYDVNASGTLTVADKGLTNTNLSFGLPVP
jgi:Divergent InlB B-repeat domain